MFPFLLFSIYFMYKLYMCKNKEDNEFLELLQTLQRYENMKQLFESKFDVDFINKRVDYLIRLELMRYYRQTIDQQTNYGHRLKNNIIT